MATYALYYWPIPFRGHFVRYVLAHVGAAWDEPDMDRLVALKNLPVREQPVPFMAPPVLHDRETDLWISQLPAILLHLGHKHNLMPGNPARDALVVKVICDAGDVLEEITLNCGKAMWTPDTWRTFAGTRLPRWMQIFEELGRAHGLTGTSGHLLGTEAPSLADLVAAALWQTMKDALPGLGDLLRDTAPRIFALSQRIADRPEIANLLTDQRARLGNSYCGGEIEASLRAVLTPGAERRT